MARDRQSERHNICVRLARRIDELPHPKRCPQYGRVRRPTAAGPIQTANRRCPRYRSAPARPATREYRLHGDERKVTASRTPSTNSPVHRSKAPQLRGETDRLTRFPARTIRDCDAIRHFLTRPEKSSSNFRKLERDEEGSVDREVTRDRTIRDREERVPGDSADRGSRRGKAQNR